MKNFLLFVFFSCICIASHSIHAQETPQWFWQANIPEDSLQSGKIYFPDSLHGYFIGQKFLNIYEDGQISTYKEAPFYHTSDGGKTWKKINYADVYGKDLHYFDTTLTPPNWDESDGWQYIVNFAAIPNSGTCVFSNMAGGGGLAPFPDTLKFYWSEDYGNTWHTSQTSPVIGRENFYWKALPADHEIIAMRAGVNTLGDKGKIFFSRDDGTTFSDVNRWDTTLLAYLNTHNDHTNNLDGNLFDYITVPGTSDIWIDIVLDTAITTDTTPYKLVTLLSTNAGYSWQAYTNTIPYFPHGDSANNIYYLQCIQGTSYVYLFTFNADPRSGNSFSFPAYGVNYLYSSDYGKTWNIDTSFSRNRKAHYVSAPGEVWCTATAHDSVTNAKPAYWITHTKDDGKNWYIDSVSLWNDGFYDGRDIAFTDPRHGWIFAQSVDRHISAIFKYLPPPKSDVKPDIYLFKQYGNRYANQINYTIHPNPANTETTIQLINGIQMTGIEFFDILGRKMLCPGIISEDQTSAVVRTDGLITGCYLAHVSLINGNYVVPFVVQH